MQVNMLDACCHFQIWSIQLKICFSVLMWLFAEKEFFLGIGSVLFQKKQDIILFVQNVSVSQ